MTGTPAPVGDWTPESAATGFPSRLRDAAERVLRALPPPAHQHAGSFTVMVDGDSVTIPYRIYSPVLTSDAFEGLTPSERVIVQCYYSRHNDGRVREWAVQGLLDSDETFVVPYVVRLVGEYVLEIVQRIVAALPMTPGAADAARYGAFVRANEGFFERITQQMVSYWNCYYRRTYPYLRPPEASRFDEYPGAIAVDRLRAGGVEH